MKKGLIIAIGAVVALTSVVAVMWSLSMSYVISWGKPFHTARANRSRKPDAGANVCIVDQRSTANEPSVCDEIRFLPAIYEAIGVDADRIIKWQDEHGFDSNGIDQTGALLAPGYPVFSKLPWSIIDPVYLGGEELSQLLEECRRIRFLSRDPGISANLERLAELAVRAQRDSKFLRIG